MTRGEAREVAKEVEGIAKDITKLGASRGARGRWWLLTMNNPVCSFAHVYQAAQLHLKSLKYMVGQHEMGDQTGTPHFQFVIWCSEAVRPSAVHKAFPGCHALFVNVPNKAVEYVTKESTRLDGPWELGIRPVRRNDKNDWERVHELARNNKIEKIPAEIQIKCMGNLIKIRDMFLKSKDSVHGKVRGLWIYGPPGTGKSFFARNYLGTDPVYPKTQGKWWDGYQQEKVVVLDDMDSDCLGHFMKIWTDVYAFLAEAKGTTVAPNHHVFVVTSNEPLEEIYKDLKPDFRQAIRRRFTVVQTHDFPFLGDDEEPDYSKQVFTLHTQLKSTTKGEFNVRKTNFTGPYELSKKLCEQFQVKFRPAIELPQGELHVKLDQAANLLEESANEDAVFENMHITLVRHEDLRENPLDGTFIDENGLNDVVENGLVNGVFQLAEDNASVLDEDEEQDVRDLIAGLGGDQEDNDLLDDLE